jgi:peptide/nickel transport system permease protein
VEKVKQFLHEPGGYRIVAGSFLVFILISATIFGNWVTSHSAQAMDIDAQLQPPTMTWLRSLLTSREGLQLWERRQQSGNAPNQEPAADSESDENFDFLRDEAQVTETDPQAEPQQKTPLSAHVLGTDKDGHDMLALLIAGAKNCLLPGLVTCAVALGLGVPLGLLAGYYGGRPRRFVQAISGTLLSMPRLVLILVVVCALEPNVYYTMAVLGVTLMPRVSELLMTRVRLLANQGFILAAKEGGLSDWRILTRHLFWYQNRQVFSIQFSLIMAESVLTETTLSYLQFGTKPPEVSWGNIIEGSQMTFFSGYYWITFFPALAIILAILGFFYVGDGMNARLTFKEGK